MPRSARRCAPWTHLGHTLDALDTLDTSLDTLDTALPAAKDALPAGCPSTVHHSHRVPRRKAFCSTASRRLADCGLAVQEAEVCQLSVAARRAKEEVGVLKSELEKRKVRPRRRRSVTLPPPHGLPVPPPHPVCALDLSAPTSAADARPGFRPSFSLIRSPRWLFGHLDCRPVTTSLGCVLQSLDGQIKQMVEQLTSRVKALEQQNATLRQSLQR